MLVKNIDMSSISEYQGYDDSRHHSLLLEALFVKDTCIAMLDLGTAGKC